ncbi:MAG: hypothetical protein ABSF44_03685 [Candidatus Bathyarchaeia archaeon]
MSLKKDKSVPQLVQKYKHQFPDLERDLLRRLIRVENPNLFLDNSSNLKKLDRYLKKAFENAPKPPKPYVTIDGVEPEWTERGFTEYPTKEAQAKGTLEFMRQRGFKYVGNGAWKKE